MVIPVYIRGLYVAIPIDPMAWVRSGTTTIATTIGVVFTKGFGGTVVRRDTVGICFCHNRICILVNIATMSGMGTDNTFGRMDGPMTATTRMIKNMGMVYSATPMGNPTSGEFVILAYS